MPAVPAVTVPVRAPEARLVTTAVGRAVMPLAPTQPAAEAEAAARFIAVLPWKPPPVAVAGVLASVPAPPQLAATAAVPLEITETQVALVSVATSPPVVPLVEPVVSVGLNRPPALPVRVVPVV